MSLLTTLKGGSLLLNSVAAGVGSVIGTKQRPVRVIKRRFPNSNSAEKRPPIEAPKTTGKAPLKGSLAALGLAAGGGLFSLPALTVAGGALASFWIVPSFRETYERMRRERRANAGFLIGLFSGVSLLWGRSVSGAAAMSVYHAGRKVIAATGRESRRVMAAAISRAGNGDAWVIRDGVEVAVPPTLVREEDIMVVNAGTVVPLDGVVVEGEAEVQPNIVCGGEAGTRRVGDVIPAATLVTRGSVRLRKAV